MEKLNKFLRFIVARGYSTIKSDKNNHLELISLIQITRETIDVCKAHFRNDLSKADWQLVVQLKKILDIM